MLQTSSSTGTSCTLADGETLLCMEGTAEVNRQPHLCLSDASKNHQESRTSPFFEDLTPYRQLRAPGVTVEHILPSTLNTSLALKSSS